MLEKRFYNMMYWGLIFLAFGIFISVTALSLYHILFALPLIYYSLKDIRSWKDIPLSSYALLGVVLVSYLSNIINFSELLDPLRSFGRQKYLLFGVFGIFPLRRLFQSYMTKKRIKRVLNIFFFTIIAAAIFGTLKNRYDFNLLKMKYEFTEHYRNGGFTGIMRYGYGMSFVLTLMTSMLIYKKKIQSFLNLKFFYLAFIIGLIGFFLSYTRGAMLGFIISLPVIFIFYKKKTGLLVLGVSLTIVTGLALISILGGNASSRFFAKLSQSSNLKRLSQYEAASKAFLERPLTGFGVEQFNANCSEIKKRHNIYYPNYCERFGLKDCNYAGEKSYCGHAHNIILGQAADTGILGVLFLILWLCLWSLELYQRHDLLGKSMLALILNVFTAGQFELIFDANNSFLLFFLYPLSFIKESTFLNVPSQ